MKTKKENPTSLPIKPLREQIWDSIIASSKKIVVSPKKFKVQRRTSNGHWYDVMLSPFSSTQECNYYIEKYKQYYPVQERIYRIIEESVD
jgi:hypothetical protein